MTESVPCRISVQVRLFGRYRYLLADGRSTITLMEGCHLSDLFSELERHIVWPDAKPLKDAVIEGTVIVSVNRRHVPVFDDRELKSGDVVGLLSPVAGG